MTLWGLLGVANDTVGVANDWLTEIPLFCEWQRYGEKQFRELDIQYAERMIEDPLTKEMVITLFSFIISFRQEAIDVHLSKAS